LLIDIIYKYGFVEYTDICKLNWVSKSVFTVMVEYI